jgi:ferredoxin
VRIKVHPALCVGWGACHRWAKDVFPLDDEGHCELRLLEVPPEYEEAARIGAGAAITVIEDGARVAVHPPAPPGTVEAR